MRGEKLVPVYLMTDMMSTGKAVEVEQNVGERNGSEQVVTAHVRTVICHQNPRTSYHSLQPRRTGASWRTG